MLSNGDNKCSGKCSEDNSCWGELRKVHIKCIVRGTDYGIFTYCEAAIASDLYAGFDLFDYDSGEPIHTGE